MVELAVLGLLKDQDLHGYELKKRLSALVGGATAVSFGSLYPALARLEALGALRVVTPSHEAQARASVVAPSVSRRQRKVYSITASGSQLFDQLLADAQSTARDGRSFSLRLAFARHLSPERRLGLLQQRRALVAERLSQLTACAARPCSDRYVQLLAEHEQDNLSADLSWLDRLITQEQSGAAPGQGNWGKGRGIPLASASQLRRSHFTNKVAAATN